MPQLIDNLATNTGESVYYEDGFRAVLEDHISFLCSDQSTYLIEVEPNIKEVYKGDLFGLLSYYNIPKHLHWLVMRMNNLTSPLEYNDNVSALLAPDSAVVDRIKISYSATGKI